jgi:uncharacterized membrane protein
MGLDAQTGAGVAYLSLPVAGGIVPLIFLLAERRNRFLRFHAAQALLLGLMPVVLALVLVGAAAAVVGGLAVSGFSTNSAQDFGTAMAIGAVIYVALLALCVAGWIWGLVVAFSGQVASLPVLGGLASRLVGGLPSRAA